jgi:hypothetical protein
MRWAGNEVQLGDLKNAYNMPILLGKLDGKESLGRCGFSWENYVSR